MEASERSPQLEMSQMTYVSQFQVNTVNKALLPSLSFDKLLWYLLTWLLFKIWLCVSTDPQSVSALGLLSAFIQLPLNSMEFCAGPGKDEAHLFKCSQCQMELLIANENTVKNLSALVDPSLTLKAVMEGKA